MPTTFSRGFPHRLRRDLQTPRDSGSAEGAGGRGALSGWGPGGEAEAKAGAKDLPDPPSPQEGAATGDGENVLRYALPETGAAAPTSRVPIFPSKPDKAATTYPSSRLTGPGPPPSRRAPRGEEGRGDRRPPLPAGQRGRHGAGGGAARQAEARRDGAGRGAAPRL